MKRLFTMTVSRKGNKWVADFGKTEEIAGENAVAGAALLLMACDNIEFRDDEFSWLIDKLTDLRDELWERICTAPSDDENGGQDQSESEDDEDDGQDQSESEQD